MSEYEEKGKASKDKLQAIHEEALRKFSKVQGVMREERQQCLEDRRFYSIAGAQWEGNLGKQFENKPKFEVNKIHLAVIRIINEYRNNRITVNFVSKDGSKNDELADKCAGLFRADEQDSVAEEAYDNAFEEAVGGGFGAIRLRADYEDDEDDENEYQRIRFEPIVDADSCVYFDLDSKRQDKSDAKFCFVLTSMSPDAFREEFDLEPVTVNKEVESTEFDWNTPDAVYVAEYYRVEETKELVHIYQSLIGEEKRVRDHELKEEPTMADELAALGYQKIREKKVKVKKVRKYIISGNEVLEDCGYIAGKCIPIIPFYGKRWFIDNVERCMGHVRLSKDMQRLANMQKSKLAELSVLSSVQKPIFTPEQIVGHEQMWAEDNLKDYPYLLNNALTDASGNPIATSPTAYTQVPQIPPAMAALIQITDTDVKELLGNQEAGEEIQSNISGKAVELIQNRLDMQSNIYITNFAKGIKRVGEVWLSMAQEVYVEEGRTLKTIGPQGEVSSTEVAKPVMTDEGLEFESDLSKAKFDVAVDVGPSSSSKKSSIVRALTGMMQIVQDQETMMVLSSMAMMNMEGEGIEEVRDYFRGKLIRIGAVKPTEEESQQLQAEMANQQPDPNAIYLQAEAEKANALAMKAQADTGLAMAKAEETKAKTIETLAGIDRDDRKQVLSEAEAIYKATSTQSQQVSESEQVQ